jgi:hypothetical protein
MHKPDATYRVTLERQPPAVLQAVIAAAPGAPERLLAYLDARGVAHSGRVSGATLAGVAGVDGRTWRKWVSVGSMPVGAARAIIAAAFGA